MINVINVNDVFMNNESNIMLRVLSYTGEGFYQSCYCALEKDGECWNWSHTSLYIDRFYTKLESL